MAESFTKRVLAALSGLAMVATGTLSLPATVAAQDVVQQYIPGIWIDPDGCEHWVMDDGEEGFMSPHRRRDGSPVCRRSEICGMLPTDQLFATDRFNISSANREILENFFREANAFGFLIYGHTDNRASDEYNIRLSENRANAVASVAQDIGARVVDVRGFGERMPRAANDTPEGGMAQNRRVEIYCLR